MDKDEFRKEAKLVAYAYKKYLIEYTKHYSLRGMFKKIPPDKSRWWKYFENAARFIIKLNTTPEKWVAAQFWGRNKFPEKMFYPPILSGPQSVKRFLDYKDFTVFVKEEDTFPRQEIYLKTLSKIYNITEKQVLATFSGEGIFTEGFYKKKTT